MESTKDDQEVTVEVVPQTVTEIIYLSDPDILNTEPNYYIPSEEELENEESESYEIGSVDPADLQHMSLILDESQSFVLLSQQDGCFDVNVTLRDEESESAGSHSDSDDEWNPQTLKEYRCDVCNLKCHTKKTLRCHKLIHQNLTVLQPMPSECVCKACGIHFDKAQTLSHHFRTCHESPKLICNICGCPCAHDSALLAHYKKHEPKQFSCDVCNSGYDNAVDLNNHKKTHNTDLLYACNKCDAGFASTAAVSAHLRSVHAKPKTVQNVKNSNNVPFINNEQHTCSPSLLNDEMHKNVECKRYTSSEEEGEGTTDEIIAYSHRSKRKKVEQEFIK